MNSRNRWNTSCFRALSAQGVHGLWEWRGAGRPEWGVSSFLHQYACPPGALYFNLTRDALLPSIGGSSMVHSAVSPGATRSPHTFQGVTQTWCVSPDYVLPELEAASCLK